MNSFSWWPLGGLGEVGMNCMVFKFGDTVIPVDAGILFADPNDFGIEALFPDYDDLLLKHRPKFWLITHAHEDHIGAVIAVLSRCFELQVPAPQFLAPPLAAALIRERLNDDMRFQGAKSLIDCIVSVDVQSQIKIDEVTVHFLETRHSTLDTCSLAFEWQSAEAKILRIVHTADFKLDAHDFEDGVKSADLYRAFGSENPDILFIDSTNAERPGRSISEKEILPGLERLIGEQPGRVFITLFSSNVYRVAAITQLAQKLGRRVCLAGRSLQSAFRISTELGFLGSRTPKVAEAELLDPAEISSHPPDKQLIICSGSQGEFRSVLARLAVDQHQHFVLQPGDSVIFSSKMIPGNERPVSRLINGLLRQGAKVFWGDFGRAHAGGPIHASGHARSDEIREVMTLLKPRHIVPVHGELRQLRSCAEIAEVAGMRWGLDSSRIHVLENGSRLHFHEQDGEWELQSRELNALPPRTLRFENFVAPSRDPFLKVRKRVAQGGIVVASLDSLGRARVDVRGLLPESFGKENFHAEFSAQLEEWVQSKYKNLLREKAFRGRDEKLELELAEDLARHVRRVTGIRPLAIFHLIAE